jgi:hypothetical protein
MQKLSSIVIKITYTTLRLIGFYVRQHCGFEGAEKKTFFYYYFFQIIGVSCYSILLFARLAGPMYNGIMLETENDFSMQV